MSKEGFEPSEVTKKNAAAGALCESVMSIVRYYDEMSKAQPKLQVSKELQGDDMSRFELRLAACVDVCVHGMALSNG